MVTILVTGSLWTERATAALLTDPRQLHNGAQYDFIVIGGVKLHSSWALIPYSNADEMGLIGRLLLVQVVRAVVSLRIDLRKSRRRRCC